MFTSLSKRKKWGQHPSVTPFNLMLRNSRICLINDPAYTVLFFGGLAQSSQSNCLTYRRSQERSLHSPPFKEA